MGRDAIIIKVTESLTGGSTGWRIINIRFL